MSSLVNDVDSGYTNSTDPDPNNNKRPKDDEIVENLLHVPIGHHYLILYSDIEAMRKIYGSYIKRQMEEQPNSVVVVLSYYDTTDNVRRVLNSKGIQVKEHEQKGSIIILDIVKVIDNPFFEVPDIERLRELAKKLVNQFEDKTVLVIADMSVFHHIKKTSELLEYEKTLHKDLKVEKWKELCLYHKNDFRSMFTEEESNKLMEYQKDKVILV